MTKKRENLPGNVTLLETTTTQPIPVARVLDFTPDDLTEVMVLGYEVDGSFYVASSETDVAGLLLLVERARKRLMEYLDD